MDRQRPPLLTLLSFLWQTRTTTGTVTSQTWRSRSEPRGIRYFWPLKGEYWVWSGFFVRSHLS
jgi:hypothetical protein